MTEERRRIEAQLLAAVQSARAEYDRLAQAYLDKTAIAVASVNSDGTLGLSQSMTAHRLVVQALARYREALREFTAVVVYCKRP